jgi:hypothetical protein
MKTWEQLRAWADDFEREYPEEVADRLRWFVEKLGVRPYHVLRLLGLSRQEASRLSAGEVGWAQIVEQVGEQAAWWADSTLRQLVGRFRYDWRALKDRLAQTIEEDYWVSLPGGREVRPGSLSPEELEDNLLPLIAQGSVGIDPALIAYLTHPVASVRS